MFDDSLDLLPVGSVIALLDKPGLLLLEADELVVGPPLEIAVPLVELLELVLSEVR